MNYYYSTPWPSFGDTIITLFSGFFALMLISAILSVTIFWIWMLIDAATRPNVEDRLVWVLLILFAHFIGAIAYYFIIRRKSLRTTPSAATGSNDTSEAPSANPPASSAAK